MLAITVLTLIYLSNYCVLITSCATYITSVSVCSKLIFISEMSKAEVYWRSVTFCKCKTKAAMLPSAGGVVETTLSALKVVSDLFLVIFCEI